MAKTKLTMELPKVGDRLTRVISEYACEYDDRYIPESCIVTYVNEEHGWYQVEFINSGIKECYGRPVYDHEVLRGLKYDEAPVICVETGMLYTTARECARDMKIPRYAISSQLSGAYPHYRGYHFDTVL